MKTIPFLFILTLFLFHHIPVSAQKTAYYTNVEEDLQVARELYRQGKYNAAYRQFEKVQIQVDPKSEQYSEALFYKAVSAVNAGHTTGHRFLERFISDYPESPYINPALFNLGNYQFERKQYAVVLRTYGEVDRTLLNQDDRIKLQYQNAYANLMQENTEQALAEFQEIMEHGSFLQPACHILLGTYHVPE
jgi:TolA-binding protein